MIVTIFSSVCGVRCGSFPRDLPKAEFSELLLKESLSLSEPGEFDNDGTSSFNVRGMSIAGTIVFSGCGAQHKVSRPHTLQLKFSSRLPSGMVLAHLEKTF